MPKEYGEEVKVGKERPFTSKNKAQNKSNRKKGWQEMGIGAKAYYWDGPNLAIPALQTAANVVTGDLQGAMKSGEKFVKGAGKYFKDMYTGYKGFVRYLANFNHPEWYGKYPELVSSNLTFGVRKQFDHFNIATGLSVVVSQTIPQSGGQTSQAYKDAINAIFVKLRGSNSGAFSYTAEDVAAYLEVARSIYGRFWQLQRNVKLVNNVDPYISQTPDVILQLAGYNPTDVAQIKANRADYINQLNQIGNALNATIPLPPDMSIMLRTKFLSDAVFCDSKGAKSSIFMYNWGITLIPDGSAGSPNADLATNNFIGSSFAAQLQFLRNSIDGFHSGYQSTTYPTLGTFDRIAGDMIRAYGSKCFVPATYVSENDRVQILFDEYSLHQIQNANLPQYANLDNSFDSNTSNTPFNMTYEFGAQVKAATTVAGAIDAQGIINGSSSGVNGIRDSEIIINTDKNAVSGLEAISLTRLCAWAKSTTGIGYNNVQICTIQECGTEIATHTNYQYYASNGTISNYVPAAVVEGNINGLDTTLWAQVDYSPVFSIYPSTITNLDYQPALDIDTYAFMTMAQFRQFNDAATLSEYKTIAIEDQANFRAAK